MLPITTDDGTKRFTGETGLISMTVITPAAVRVLRARVMREMFPPKGGYIESPHTWDCLTPMKRVKHTVQYQQCAARVGAFSIPERGHIP